MLSPGDERYVQRANAAVARYAERAAAPATQTACAADFESHPRAQQTASRI